MSSVLAPTPSMALPILMFREDKVSPPVSGRKLDESARSHKIYRGSVPVWPIVSLLFAGSAPAALMISVPWAGGSSAGVRVYRR